MIFFPLIRSVRLKAATASSRAATLPMFVRSRMWGSSNPGCGADTAGGTPFLTGAGERGWRADFDWFIANDTNCIAVLKGKYDAHPSVRTAQSAMQPGMIPQTREVPVLRAEP